jgi:hypothetical protein
MAKGDTLVNAFIGAIVTIIGSGFVPFVPILGGGVAAYLEGGDRGQGIRVGLYAGLIALVPFILFAVLLSGFIGMMGFGFMQTGMPTSGFGTGLTAFAVIFVVVVGMIYVVGLSALGGWLGNYIKYETDIGS